MEKSTAYYQKVPTKILYQKLPKFNQYQKLFKNKIYYTFYFGFTIYALTGDDLRQLLSSVQSDWFFYLLMICCFFFFLFDLIFQMVILKGQYIFSLFFLLDFIGTFSLLLDIGWINQIFFQETSRNEYTVLARTYRVTDLHNWWITRYDYISSTSLYKILSVSNFNENFVNKK